MPVLDGFELKLGRRTYLFWSNDTPFNNSSSGYIAADKYCTNQLLERAGIPVPKAISLDAHEFEAGFLDEKIKTLTFPLVIKPLLNGSHGIDVLCNIKTMAALKQFLTDWFKRYDLLIIEEFHGGLKSYRVLVFNKRVIGVVRRYPASIVGDGKHTIKELVEESNNQRAIDNPALGPIVLDDEEAHIKLDELGMDKDTIPAQGVRVVLCYTSNAIRGGTFAAIGKQICKENKQLMIKTAAILNLNLAGIDIECADINIPFSESKGVIIEVNHRPSIRIHEFPMSGQPHRVTRKILRSLIYRHPFSYLYSLYTNRPTSFYLKSFTMIAIVVFIQRVFVTV